MFDVCENDFSINSHYIILDTRAPDFLTRHCTKWDPLTGSLEKGLKGPGYYVVDADISRFSTLKFLQVVYTDKIAISSKELDQVRIRQKSENPKPYEQILISEGFPKLISTLKNEGTKKYVLQFIENGSFMYTNVSTQSLFDEFDEKLLEDEYNYFFGKANARYYYQPKDDAIDTFNTEFLRRKQKIKDHAASHKHLEEDFLVLFQRLICTHFEVETVPLQDSMQEFYPDIKVMTDAEDLQEIDNILEESMQNNQLYDAILHSRGFYVHRAILCARSEYFKKVLQYETEERSSLIGICKLHNVSLSTLAGVFQYIYSGIKEEEIGMFTENLVECFIASDLFLLFGLKKYTEQKICSHITEENVEDLYSISIVYNSEIMKAKCVQIMTELNIPFSTNISEFR